jgi:glycine hydroxymethyltransferase
MTLTTAADATADAQYPTLKANDREVFDLLASQHALEQSTLKMIASENYAPMDVLEATGSILTNKYAEGYAGRRYYEGNTVIDELELLAIARVKSLFGAEHANVQPLSGSPANQAVYRALCVPGDRIMGMPIPLGGHLTHGWKVSFSGQTYEQVPYGPDPETGLFDFSEIHRIAKDAFPRMIWVGATAYPRKFDYERFADIANEVGAYLVADISHINGLIAAGLHPDPVPVADVVSSTTHKVLGGPRGAFILSRAADRYADNGVHTQHSLAKRIDRAVFPELQGGPHMNAIAGMAVAFRRAASTCYREYAIDVIKNARALSDEFQRLGYSLVSGGTDNHMIILDFSATDMSGKDVAKALDRAGVVANFNTVPGDRRPPAQGSGVRLGTPALTTTGMGEDDMRTVARLIDRVCRNLYDDDVIAKVRSEVASLCQQFTPGGTVANNRLDQCR